MRPITLALRLSAAALTIAWIRERTARRAAERFGAAAFQALLYAIDANDPDTGQHVRRVAAYADVLAERAGLDESGRRAVERAALFHDIGKIAEALFDIVHDSGELSEADRQAIATHPRRGADVLAPLTPFYPELAAAVLSHHERWDGTGYPRGLAGTRIPLAARIVAIADSFDAITHARRYSPGHSDRTALQAIVDGRGSQFDPRLVDLFVEPRTQYRLRRAARELRRAARSSGSGRRRSAPLPQPMAPDVAFRWRQAGAPGGGWQVRTSP